MGYLNVAVNVATVLSKLVTQPEDLCFAVAQPIEKQSATVPQKGRYFSTS
jgi:hypothetical protein